MNIFTRIKEWFFDLISFGSVSLEVPSSRLLNEVKYPKITDINPTEPYEVERYIIESNAVLVSANLPLAMADVIRTLREELIKERKARGVSDGLLPVPKPKYERNLQCHPMSFRHSEKQCRPKHI